MSDPLQDGPAAVFLSASPEETRALGEVLGRYARAGDLIALVGELGSGKTVLVKGLALGLGVDPGTPVTSPTFTILHQYSGRLPLFHIDLYRIDSLEALLALGLEEYLGGEGVAVIEWAEHGREILPNERLTVRLRTTGLETRLIELWYVGERYRRLVPEVACDMVTASGFLAGSLVQRGMPR